MAQRNPGKVTQIIGAVVDIKFDGGNLPEINEAIEIPMNDGSTLVVEVSQHLGDDTVRCIAMGSTDGMVRGMAANATGAPISVPVGENTLGRMFNVLGQPIDNKPAPEGVEHMPIHRTAPEFRNSPRIPSFWRPVSRWWICSVLIRRAVKSDSSAAPAWERRCSFRSLSVI